MKPADRKKVYRLIDANLNRAKEGLRVCEDLFRFIKDDRALTRSFKNLRHELTDAVGTLKIKKYVQDRAIEKDVGKKTSVSETKRSDVNDVLFANMQRIKESIRVLEEFTKLVDAKASQVFKTLRYKFYAIEKRVIKKS